MTGHSAEIGTPAIAAAVGGALRYVAGLTHARGREDEAREWYEIAAEVEQHDYSDSWCCPLCEEMTCDNGCPLEPLRRGPEAMQSGRKRPPT